MLSIERWGFSEILPCRLMGNGKWVMDNSPEVETIPKDRLYFRLRGLQSDAFFAAAQHARDDLCQFHWFDGFGQMPLETRGQ